MVILSAKPLYGVSLWCFHVFSVQPGLICALRFTAKLYFDLLIFHLIIIILAGIAGIAGIANKTRTGCLKMTSGVAL